MNYEVKIEDGAGTEARMGQSDGSRSETLVHPYHQNSEPHNLSKSDFKSLWNNNMINKEKLIFSEKFSQKNCFVSKSLPLEKFKFNFTKKYDFPLIFYFVRKVLFGSKIRIRIT